MESKHYAIIVGTRPNFVKAAPLLKMFKHHGVRTTLIHTRQHHDDNMAGVFFEQLGIPTPDVLLSGSNILSDLCDYYKRNTFDGTIVFGDVDSTLYGAMASYAGGTDVFHIEAGLRSEDERMPEERNRKIVDHISKLHFVTEPSAIDNLHDEGIYTDIAVGNLMIESLEKFGVQIDRSDVIERYALIEGCVILTLHRRENIYNKERLESLLKTIEKLSEKVNIIFPVHPGTMMKIEEYGFRNHLWNVLLVPPLSYFDFMKLVKTSSGVVTDSGGIQEETTHLGIPCCTLRNNTERPITLSVGSNRLFPEWDENVDEMVAHLSTKFEAKPVPMWDTAVSRRIYENIRSYSND